MASILALLIQYKYFILFPIIVIEGPFATVISGFLISLGIFNVFIAFPIIILGDLTSDSFFYFLGRFGHKSITKWALYFGVNKEKLENAKKYFAEKSTKAIIASKFIHGVGVSGLMAAGMLKIPYFKYAKVCLITDVLQFGILLAIGYFFGHSYKLIAVYLDNYAKIISSVVVLLIIGLFIFFKYKEKKAETK
jgi:undecaprenyl-diphosphatase